MKVIRCNTPKGQYDIPLEKVAENRADYYAIEVDGFQKNSKEWKDEVSFAINDNFECIDWLLNNTDWEDWKNVAVKINENVNVTGDDFWCNSDDFKIMGV